MNSVYWSIETVSSFVEAFLSFVFCSAFFNEKIRDRMCSIIFLSVFISAFIIFLNTIKIASIINTIAIISVNLIALSVVFKREKKKLILFDIIYYVVMMFCDIIVATFVGLVLDVSISTLVEQFSAVRVIGIVTSKTLLLIFVLLFKHFSFSTVFLNKRFYIILSSLTILIALLSSTFFVNQVKNASKDNSDILMILYLSLFSVLLILYFLIFYYSKAEMDKQKLNLMEQQNIFLEKSLKEQENAFELWRKSVHDYKNSMYALGNMIATNALDELKKFVDEKIEIFKDSAIYLHTGNSTADIVINSKMRLAESKDILFTTNLKFPDNMAVSDVDIAVILGNLLDNAIEAVENETDKYIHIQTFINNNLLILEISNSYSKSIISDVTTKKDKTLHGIGLLSVKHIANKYDGSFTLNVENNLAVAIVGLKI